jgi:hypothetical protein
MLFCCISVTRGAIVTMSDYCDVVQVTVREMTRTPGYLLEIASVLSGLNIEVLQGVIQVRLSSTTTVLSVSMVHRPCHSSHHGLNTDVGLHRLWRGCAQDD